MDCTDVGAIEVCLGSSFVVLRLTPPQCCNSTNTPRNSATTIWAPVGASPISISSPDAGVSAVDATTASDTSPTAGAEITAPSNLFTADATSLEPVLEAIIAGDVDPAADTQTEAPYNPFLVDTTSLVPVPEADVAANVALNNKHNSLLVDAPSLAPVTTDMVDDSRTNFRPDPIPTSPCSSYTPMSPVTGGVFPLEAVSHHPSKDGVFAAISVRCFVPFVPQLG